MRAFSLLTLIGLFLLPAGSEAEAQSKDSLDLIRLEKVWNDAHLAADTTTLAALWSPELIVEVPGMPVMTRADLLGFWRSGRSRILRYATDQLAVQVAGDSGTVSGRLYRQRDFNGKVVSDSWDFTKVYRRRGADWQVIRYRAVEASP